MAYNNKKILHISTKYKLKLRQLRSGLICSCFCRQLFSQKKSTVHSLKDILKEKKINFKKAHFYVQLHA